LVGILEQQLAIIDIDIQVANVQCLSNLARIDSIIDFYDQEITQRMEGRAEDAEKRRIHVKREVLGKKSLVLVMAKSFLPAIFPINNMGDAAYSLPAFNFSDIIVSPGKKRNIVSVFEESFDDLVDEYILSIDKAISVAQRDFVVALEKVDSKISYFDQSITQQMDNQPMPESAEKRCIYVKREILNRKSQMIRIATHFMTESFVKGFNLSDPLVIS
jgi:hypothetical protein